MAAIEIKLISGEYIPGSQMTVEVSVKGIYMKISSATVILETNGRPLHSNFVDATSELFSGSGEITRDGIVLEKQNDAGECVPVQLSESIPLAQITFVVGKTLLLNTPYSVNIGQVTLVKFPDSYTIHLSSNMTLIFPQNI